MLLCFLNCAQAGLPVGVRKSAMNLICKILALSSTELMNDIVNAPADSGRDSSLFKSPSRVLDGDSSDAGAATPSRLDRIRPAPVSPEDAVRGSASTSRDARVSMTPESRDRVNGSDRIRSRSRKCGLVSMRMIASFDPDLMLAPPGIG